MWMGLLGGSVRSGQTGELTYRFRRLQLLQFHSRSQRVIKSGSLGLQGVPWLSSSSSPSPLSESPIRSRSHAIRGTLLLLPVLHVLVSD